MKGPEGVVFGWMLTVCQKERKMTAWIEMILITGECYFRS